MSSKVQHEFFHWLGSLDATNLTDIDRKLLNLYVTNFDTLEPLSTTGGNKRAKAISELIQKHHATLSTELPDTQIHHSGSSEKIDRITELKIGPFRGFATKESFTFDKKYTFMYGPNGSGKSSFCEGLEYALLGCIEEADAKRIALNGYVLNTQKKIAKSPIAYGINCTGQKVVIQQDQALYQFAFVEKNRIDGFARITATTASAQKDRIATLFGLNAFSVFVDGFTDDFERYIPLSNAKEAEFKTASQKHDEDTNRVTEIDAGLLENAAKSDALIKEVGQKEILTLDDLKLFLTGADGISGKISELQQKKVEKIPEDLKTESIASLPIVLSDIRAALKSFDSAIEKLKSLSSEVNYKDLYSAVASIGATTESDTSRCPACKTPIERVNTNPFDNAKAELGKLKSLTALQTQISENGNSLATDVRTAIQRIREVNQLGVSSGYVGVPFPELSEFIFSNTKTLANWKPRLDAELLDIENLISNIEVIRTSAIDHNAVLSTKRLQQNAIDGELKKFQVFNISLIKLMTNEKNLAEEKATRLKAINDFLAANAEKIKDIEVENQKIAIYQQFADAYKKLISNLKSYRNLLPSQLAADLSEKVKEYYNVVNAHDPDFELLDSLSLPDTPGAKIEIRFKGDSRTHDALHILSDGHIKVLGLSILIAKAVQEKMGFLIFDDIVNAIDDDHRSGIAELLMSHPDLKDRQHIVTCHGDTFINKLEHTLGTSLSGKEAKHYRFCPVDTVETRGVRVAIGDSKHYLIKARESFEQNALKDSASACRLAVESISYQLWKKIDKRLKVNLTVTMRAPGYPPDLSTVVDSLIKQLKKISGVDNLCRRLAELKEKYSWSLLNKGVHEDESQPEFDRKDISGLLALVQSIEEDVSSLKLAVMGDGEVQKGSTTGCGSLGCQQTGSAERKT